MRIAIPHRLGKAEVRRRIVAGMGRAEEKAGAMLGGAMTLMPTWIDDDHLSVAATAMGYTVPTTMEITDTTVVFEVTIPAGLGFARGVIERAITERGEKLVA